MVQESADIKKIVSKVHIAFGCVERPAGRVLHKDKTRAEDWDVYCAFKDKDWRELDGRYLMNHCIRSIELLGFEEYRYFLPAFILAVVKDFSACFEIAEDVVLTLLPPVTRQRIFQPELYKANECVDMYTFQCRMDVLTCQQVEVVVDFLRFLSKYHSEDFDYNEPQLGLNEYWLERLGNENGNW